MSEKLRERIEQLQCYDCDVKTGYDYSTAVMFKCTSGEHLRRSDVLEALAAPISVAEREVSEAQSRVLQAAKAERAIETKARYSDYEAWPLVKERREAVDALLLAEAALGRGKE